MGASVFMYTRERDICMSRVGIRTSERCATSSSHREAVPRQGRATARP